MEYSGREFPSESISLFASQQGMLGARLHALVCSSRTGVGVLGKDSILFDGDLHSIRILRGSNIEFHVIESLAVGTPAYLESAIVQPN